MTKPLSSFALWDFSLAVYVQPGVATACLQLQDEHGVNVNLLLWCLWLDRLGVGLEATHLQEAQHQIAEWHLTFVVPLRELRRRMKSRYGTANSDREGVRAQIKQAELAAEQEEQRALQQLTDQWWTQGVLAVPSGDKTITAQNLRRYLDGSGVPKSQLDELAQWVSLSA